MKQKTMALVTANDVTVIPQELWSKLIDLLHLLKGQTNDNELQRCLGVCSYIFSKWEQDVKDTQRLYLECHPCGYSEWEVDVVNNAIERLNDELRILCEIKKEMTK